MKIMLYDKLDREIIKFLQGSLPLESRPYAELAEHLQVSEEEIVARIGSLADRGIIRRLGAVLRHQRAGYRVNAMVAWKTDVSNQDRSGQIMAEFPQVSHCYLREVPPDFAYNLFSMIHARSEEELKHLVAEISLRTGLDDYLVIRSIKEMKKVSMEYYR